MEMTLWRLCFKNKVVNCYQGDGWGDVVRESMRRRAKEEEGATCENDERRQEG
jgi:hypothetical protein